jgi:hypothetical protein
LRFNIAETLNNQYSGIIIKFYNSQIADYVHNIKWVKSVSVRIFDNTNLEIPDSNIESYDSDKIVDTMSKEVLLDYTPPYWYWNVNNIEMNYVLN